jgi:nucleoside-diphosphate-sugar epimerase
MSESICVVTGGCGFVGRHLVAKLQQRHEKLFLLDNLSTGQHPSTWLHGYSRAQCGHLETFTRGDNTIYFLQADAIDFFWRELRGERILGADFVPEAYHLASIVGGRAVIDGDPLLVATDLAIDALFFRWVVKNKERIGRVLFASSSAAYPIDLQQTVGRDDSIALHEGLISFEGNIGKPDMTYGWSKLTGEYLATLAAERYGIKIACVRPFSGYGEDQDLTYPVPAIALRAACRENPLTVWGTGKQGRDFVYIDDCIDAMLLVIEKVSDGRGINIGTGQLASFIEVAHTFARLEGYDAEIKPLVNAPVGVQSRYCNPELIRSLGWRPQTSLDAGFAKVLDTAHRRRAAARAA